MLVFEERANPEYPEKNLSEELALYTKRSHGAKQTTLLDGKQRSGTLKGKGVSFLDDVLAHCVVCHPVRCFFLCDRFMQRAHTLTKCQSDNAVGMAVIWFVSSTSKSELGN